MAKQKLNITLEENIKNMIIQEAEKIGMSASAFITMLILNYRKEK